MSAGISSMSYLAPSSTSPLESPRQVSAHLDEVDDTFEAALEADRKLDDEGLGTEALDDRVDRVENRLPAYPSC
jgi:hypothetical protein